MFFRLKNYNVIWTSTSKNSSESMPLGNGSIACNVWLEPSGDLLLFIASPDAWSEFGRLLKLTKLRVTFSSALPLDNFRQELDIVDGVILFNTGNVSIKLWIDQQNIIRIGVDSPVEQNVSVKNESWRTAPHLITPTEDFSCYSMMNSPFDKIESADNFFEREHAIGFYHHNNTSCYEYSMRLQGLESLLDKYPDPLLNNTFGAIIVSDELSSVNAMELHSKEPVKQCQIKVAVNSLICENVHDFIALTQKQLQNAGNIDESLNETKEYWHDFWSRSWIIVDKQDSDFSITSAYLLQKFITNCTARGEYPIKFNGSLFTFDPELVKGEIKSNPDYRRWGDCYWFQNTRLPYSGMLAQGDYETLMPFFDMYKNMMPLCRDRVKIYFPDAEGAFFPETCTFYGLYANVNYGYNRGGLNPSEVTNHYIRYIWSEGLELLMLMLDYYDYTLDAAFVDEYIQPMAEEILKYFGSRFINSVTGKLEINPTQAIETFQQNVTNDTPCIAGLHAVLPRLMKLPVNDHLTTICEKLLDALVPIPTCVKNGAAVLDNAQTYDNIAVNVENPELYPIFPFNLMGIGRDNLQLAIDSFNQRTNKSTGGWQQNGMQAAICGLSQEALSILENNVKQQDAEYQQIYRFPAFWGPNYDWTPDQDHGSNIVTTLQLMLIQCVNERIILFPAWPLDIGAEFKLYAAANTSIQIKLHQKKVINFVVTSNGAKSHEQKFQLKTMLRISKIVLNPQNIELPFELKDDYCFFSLNNFVNPQQLTFEYQES